MLLERDYGRRAPSGPTVSSAVAAPTDALGGADAVEKTTYVSGKGTEPEAQHKEGTPTARVPSGSGHGATWAIIGFLAVMAVLVYLLGFGR